MCPSDTAWGSRPPPTISIIGKRDTEGKAEFLPGLEEQRSWFLGLEMTGSLIVERVSIALVHLR